MASRINNNFQTSDQSADNVDEAKDFFTAEQSNEEATPNRRSESQNFRKPAFEGTGRLSDVPMSTMGKAIRSRTGEYLSRFVKTLNEILKETDEKEGYTIVAIDGVQTSMMYSTVNVVYEDKNQTKTPVIFCHTLLLAGSGERPAPIMEEYDGQRFQIPQTPGNTWTTRTFNQNRDLVIAKYGIPNVGFKYCGIHVIDDTVDPTNVAILQDILAYAKEATYRNYITKMHPDQFFHVGLLNHESNIFEISVDSSGEPTYTSCNIPQRSDVKLVLNYIEQNEDRQRIQPLPLTHLSANIEFFYNPVEVEEDRYRRNRSPFDKVWRAVCNINEVCTSKRLPEISDETVLFALATANTMAESNQWIGAVRKKTLRDRNYDIGALAVLASDKRVMADGLKSPGTSDDDFGGFLLDVTDEQLYFGLVVNEVGEQGWQMNNFIREAQAKGARGVLRKAADRLLLGQFSEYMPDDEPLLYDTRIRRLVGTITDNTNNQTSLDDLDIVSFITRIMNNSNGDIDIIYDYLNTFSPSYPPNVQIAKRTNILNSLFGDSINITGTAAQFLFPANTYKALAAALKTCGVVVERSSIQSYYSGGRRRGMADAFNGVTGMSANGGSDMFGSNRNRNSGSGSRWDSRIY